LDVEVTFNSSSAVQLPAVALLVADPNTGCSKDSDCNILTPDCNTSRACFTGECTTGNKCVGAGVCLPSSTCAIEQLVMRASPDNWREDFTVANNSRHLRTATPMYGNVYYLLVKDFTGQNFDSASQPYTITVNVINEPDQPNEINSLYLPYVDDNADKDFREVNAKIYAKDVTCTAVSATEYDCGTITGYLSFRGDQDWYRLVNITGIHETSPATQWKDWNMSVAWTNDSSTTDLNFEIFAESDLKNPKISVEQSKVTYTAIGGTTAHCSYICGEYSFVDGSTNNVYLRVQHANRVLYDYQHKYTLTIKATQECPANCGHCNSDCGNYHCPSPSSPTGSGSNCGD
jgi:hypothetical protein